MKELQKLREDFEKQTEKFRTRLVKLEAGEQPKKDYSKWIGRYGRDLAIFGDLMLKSWSSGGITWNEDCREYYEQDTPDYKEVTCADLKRGDVVCMNPYQELPQVLNDFGIFVGIDNGGEYSFQYLDNLYEIEVIRSCDYDKVHKVHRFLRE